MTEQTGKVKESQDNSSSEQQSQIKSDDPLSTIDSKDIQHLAQHCDVWWDLNSKLRPLHDMNPFRIKLIREALASTGFEETSKTRFLEGVRILDVGCGGGILSEALAKVGAQVTGLDASEELVEVAKFHATLDGSLSDRLSYVVSTIEDFSLKNKDAYDVVVASEVLEHVQNPEIFVKHCVEVLKPKGSMIVTTINRTYMSWMYAINILEYVTNTIVRGTHEWDKFITPEETRAFLKNYNCQTKFVRGMIYNPLRLNWLEIPWNSVWYALHAVKNVQNETKCKLI